MSFTTPPRPLDVTVLFPDLAPLARTATRLHPRPGAPSVYDSSVGGPLLWPADEPWPHCEESHVRSGRVGLSPDDVRQLRRNRAATALRRSRSPQEPWITPEERAAERRLQAGRPWPEGPIPLLPVAQLYARDVPLPISPPGADLLQVLWCPFNHPAHPRTVLFWRISGTVNKVLDAAPEPAAMQSSDYLPQPSRLAPEQVTEYPHPLELSQELQLRLKDRSRWEAAGAAWDRAYDDAPDHFYVDNLSYASGWKTGGWSRWGLTDPTPRPCPECSTEAYPLLAIASTEWDAGSDSWIPKEERSNPTSTLPGTPPANFTLIDIAGGYGLQLHVCPASPKHPHIELIQ
ncbi:hypothetical protein ACIRF8_35605 [Streptomyces sp. NPDC102406]|uniref:hypothetical protein n=1 Tax=Streptomyces sp. NPDC102406 TaxID=3366171 RepID=UPI0038077112